MAKYDEVKQQLGSLSAKVQAMIALRSALRVLPLLSVRSSADKEPFAYWGTYVRSRQVLMAFQLCQVSALRNSLEARSFGQDFRVLERYTADFLSEVRAAASCSKAAEGASLALDRYCDAESENDGYRGDFWPEKNDAMQKAADFATQRATECSIACCQVLRNDTPLLADLDRAKKIDVMSLPLWPEGMGSQFQGLWARFQEDLCKLSARFEVWIDWYQDRLDGKPFDWETERQWALLSEERLAQSPAEINAYLKALRDGALTKQLKRVRAIFIGHGEVGKTSLINVLQGGEPEPPDQTTKGVAIKDVIENAAGVFTQIKDYLDDDLTVHFWDFGGQVMAHATHQFFLRSKCLYVIVLAGRAQRNPNEEAEYWLEHVRAFGDSAPVLIVGNKMDVMPIALDLLTLKEKYPNIVAFYPLSCTQAKGAYRNRFEVFREEFSSKLKELGRQAERFSLAQFKVLKSIEDKAAKEDFLSQAGFDDICKANGVAMEGPGGRGTLLDIFDKLGIVMHFAKLAYLRDYVLNPRWLTYGVYTIMYSEAAQRAKGRLSERNLVDILGTANPSIPNGHKFCYPAERCRIIADAMIAFGVAYPLGADGFVIPALLAPEQPAHDFRPDGAISFQFDFGGFLPRHVLPALIVEQHRDIAKIKGSEIVWQNGVLLRPQRYDAEAFVRADHHTRTLDILAKGTDGNFYLGMLRDCILRNLETMPQLPFEEKVQLRSEMRADAGALDALGDKPIMMDYGAIASAQKLGIDVVVGSDGKPYSVKKILAVMPIEAALRLADVFLSYAREDRSLIESLADQIGKANISVWFDRELVGGQPFRSVLKERIETTKAVVVLWTETSIKKEWVIAEASLAAQDKKLICLRHPDLDPRRVPLPFSANDHIIKLGDMPGLIAALALKGAKPLI